MVRSEVLEPKSLAEACSMLARYKGLAKVIAGGQNLLVLLRQRRIKPRYLVNIKGLSELEYIKDGKGILKLGTLTTHSALETSSLAAKAYPVLIAMEKEVGSVQTKNWGTIGGNLCQASPTTDLPPVFLALKGSVKAASIRGERVISLDDFFVDYHQTCLEADEIVTEIQLPRLPPRAGVVYRKEAVRFGDSPLASVGAMVKLGERGVIEEARIILQAVAATPLRAKDAEKAITGEKVDEKLLERAAQLAVKQVPSRSSEYKREMAKVLTRDALSEALKAARAG